MLGYSQSGRRAALYFGSLIVVAGVYYGAGKLGLEIAYLNGAVAAIWPPVGVGIGAIYLLGLRVVPGIVVADLLLGDYSTPLGTVLAQTVGNTVAVVVAALLLRRLVGDRAKLDEVRQVLAVVLVAAVAAAVSACFGPTSLWLGDVIPGDEVARVFRTWFLGDMVGRARRPAAPDDMERRPRSARLAHARRGARRAGTPCRARRTAGGA